MKLTVVGCSGSIPGPDSASSCYLLEHDDFRVVIDLGHGALGQLQRYIPLEAIDAVVLSHLHADHCVDLVALQVAHRYGSYSFDGPIPVFGPDDAAERVAAIAGMATIRPLQSSFTFRELGVAASIGPFRVRAERVAHPVEAYGVRFEAADGSLTYSGDTGPCQALIDLADGVDVLLAEASFVHGADNPADLHLTGRDAGQAATAAGAGRLVVTHVPPWYDAASMRREASEAFAGPVDLATPGLVLDLGR